MHAWAHAMVVCIIQMNKASFSKWSVAAIYPSILFLPSPYIRCGRLPPGGPHPPLTGGGSASSCSEGKEKDEGK